MARKAIILGGGPAKQLEYVMGTTTSRVLLRFPGGRLLDIHLESLSSLYDAVYLVSDDNQALTLCANSPRCIPVKQSKPGIGGAICSGLEASGAVDEPVTILYGDTYYGPGYMLSHVEAAMSGAAVTVTRPLRYRPQYFRLDIDPVTTRVRSTGRGDYIFTGLLTAPADIVRKTICLEGHPVETLLERLAEEYELRASIWIGEWVDIDTAWDYMVAVRLALQHLRGTHISAGAEVKSGVEIEGPVYIEDRALVDYNAVIKGPAYIGRNTLIGAHSFLRSHVAVFDSAVVGAHSEVKRSIVYDGARVGSFTYIADSVIGYSAVVAPYTVTLNTPYTKVSLDIQAAAYHPLEGLKIGSIVKALTETKPHEVIEAATIYTGRERRG